MNEARSPILVTLVALAAACASSTPPAEPPTPAATGVTPPASPVTPTRASLGPGEIVCGVDDGPVPIGQAGRDDLRREGGSASLPRPVAALTRAANLPFLGEMMAEPPDPPVEAARPTLALSWKLGAPLVATPTFAQRARECEALVQLGDPTERTFSVQASRSGPLAVRDTTPTASKLSSCLTNALCALGAESGGGSGIVEAHLTATITAPVFQGHVAITIGDERPRTYRPSPHSRRGQIALPLPPRPAASEAYAKQLADRLRPIAEACAARRPPAAGFVTTVVFAWAKDGTRTLPAQTTPRTLVSAFDSCLALGAEALVGRPPRDFNPHDRVPIVAHVELAPAPAVLPPPSSSSGLR